MKRFVTLGLTAIVSTAILAQTAAPAGDAQNGKKLFAADGCYQCHGYEAQGATPTGPRLGPKPIAFTQFSKYVRQPTGQMPPYTVVRTGGNNCAALNAGEGVITCSSKWSPSGVRRISASAAKLAFPTRTDSRQEVSTSPGDSSGG